MMATLPETPPQLKAIQSYMKTASDVERIDPVLSYWCRLYSVQTALEIDKSSPESKSFLSAVMDWMYKFKDQHKANEAVTRETVGQAHVENFVMNLFNKVDSMDRAGEASKTTIKMFFMAACIFEAMAVFGPLTEEVAQRAKYAKFKAAYIQKCLKNGETPHPGPLEGFDTNDPDLNLADDLKNSGPTDIVKDSIPSDIKGTGNLPSDNSTMSHVGQPSLPKSSDFTTPDKKTSFDEHKPYIPSSSNLTTSTTEKSCAESHHQTNPSSLGTLMNSKLVATNGQPLGPEAILKSQKYCKFAGSALQYDDIKTAVESLEKALKILSTGSE